MAFALHASPDAPAAAAALRAAGALFVPAGAEAPPLAGCSAAGWPAAASVEDESAPLPTRFRRRREADAQLVLTACALPPGVRAGLFQGDSTSVPDLPDLAGALTSRPPHLVLLSHAQFDVTALMDRMEALLPGSGVAAAVAQPVDGPRGGGGGDDDDRERVTPRGLAAAPQQQPQLCVGGAPQSRPGFAGVTLSREPPPGGERDTASPPELPMSVQDFATLARVLLGSWRAKGWTFTAAVQTSLFLPADASVPLSAASPPDAALAAALYPEGTAGRLPLFELEDVVMLPGGREELVIFEPRYRLMVRAAVEAFAAAAASGAPVPPPGALFGVVSRGVGVAVALGGYRLDRSTGKAHVVARGGRRFRVTLRSALSQPMASFGLSVADVTWFDDVPSSEDFPETAPALEAAARAALAGLRAALDEAATLAKAPLPRAAAVLAAVEAHAPVAAGGDGDLEALSWELAALLPFGQERARAWRDVTCTRLRLEDQAHLLTARRRIVADDFARNLRDL